MKKFLFAAIAAALSFTAQAQTAQDTTSVSINEAEKAVSVSVFTNGNCYDVFVAEDGTLTIDLHGGLYGGVSGNATFHSFSNNDGVGDIGSKEDYGFKAILGYRMVRTGWPVALLGEIYGGLNSPYHVENRSVRTHLDFGARALVELSHGAVLPAIGAGYGYENGVSENLSANPWKGNKQRPELLFRLTSKIGSIKQYKTAHVDNKKILVRGLREVKLYAQVAYSPLSVKKYWEGSSSGFQPEQKDKEVRIELGLTFGIR